MKKSTVKKVILIAAVLALALAMTACGAKNSEDPGDSGESANMKNPVVDYESLEEINEIAGSNLVHPGVMGVEEKRFSVINDEIAQYDFSIAGIDYSFRGSSKVTEDDISGIYIGGKPAFSGAPSAEIEYSGDDSVKAARWTLGGCQYVLMANNGGDIEQEAFEGVAGEMQVTVAVKAEPTVSDEPDLSEYAGNYQDLTSQRAMAEMTEGANGLDVLVSWASSAMEHTEWTMTLKLADDGTFKYANGRKLEYTADENGEEKETIIEEGESGYFELIDGNFCWTGAPEEDCRECVFEKMGE